MIWRRPAWMVNEGAITPLTPLQMMRLRKEEKAALMAAYIDVARDLQVDITGMGAFTSVISRGGMDLQGTDVHLSLSPMQSHLIPVETLDLDPLGPDASASE